MISFSYLASLVSLLIVSSTLQTVAQQYAGDNINNTLPSVPGSELSYFRIQDPAGLNNNLTLINYFSLQPNGSRLNPSQIIRAVVVIHGLNQDPGTYMSSMLSALSQEKSNPSVNFSSVAIMAPFFVNGDSKGTSYPWAAGGGGSTSNCIVWKGSQWSAGANNQYPKTSTTVSSYEVLDQLIKYFDDKTMFPNLKHIVIAGHSLGAQTVQRYAMIGNDFSTTSKVTYWIGNPNSFVWPSLSRPIASLISSCPTYDNYRDGYSNFTGYPMSYGLSIVNSGRDAILARYNSRSKTYARGTIDEGDDSSSCNPFTTGLNRNERFYNFIKAFPPSCTPGGTCDTIDYVPLGHDAPAMFASPAGRARLFLDDFFGDGSKAYDFGYPRNQIGDDPWPNPAYSNSSSLSNDTTTYPGNMTYKGCWTDTSGSTMPFLAYDNNNNTVELCTATCTELGYTIAGLEYGSQCRCANSISANSEQTVEMGCTMACTGNSNQTCGNSYRVNMYATSELVQNKAPTAPANVTNYGFYGCMTEPASGRALIDNSYMDGTNMTLKSCASFCEDYQYFGVEYSSQCYCGQNFTIGANITSKLSCSMTCSGNSTEFCGGPNLLSVYTRVYALARPSSTTSVIPSSTSKMETPTVSSSLTTVPSSLSLAATTSVKTTSLSVKQQVTSSPSSVRSLSTTTKRTTTTSLKPSSKSSSSTRSTTRTTTKSSTTTRPKTTTTSFLVWNSHCSASCKVKNCAGYETQVLSYCKAHATATVLKTLTKLVTSTVTKTNAAKVATVKKVIKSTSTKKKTTTTTKKSASTSAASCAKVPAVLGGNDCAQVSSICSCLVPPTATKAVVVTKIVTTTTKTVFPAATRTIIVKR